MEAVVVTGPAIGQATIDRVFKRLGQLTERINDQWWSHRALGKLAPAQYSDGTDVERTTTEDDEDDDA